MRAPLGTFQLQCRMLSKGTPPDRLQPMTPRFVPDPTLPNCQPVRCASAPYRPVKMLTARGSLGDLSKGQEPTIVGRHRSLRGYFGCQDPARLRVGCGLMSSED